MLLLSASLFASLDLAFVFSALSLSVENPRNGQTRRNISNRNQILTSLFVNTHADPPSLFASREPRHVFGPTNGPVTRLNSYKRRVTCRCQLTHEKASSSPHHIKRSRKAPANHEATAPSRREAHPPRDRQEEERRGRVPLKSQGATTGGNESRASQN